MAYFPFFIDVKNRKCYIFGGGVVAYRKIVALLEFGADITVISPTFCEEIKNLGSQIQRIPRGYTAKDLEAAFFVIAATDDVGVNSSISKECFERNILVNVVDVLDECSFLFPAYVKRGDIAVGVTTSGKSPVMAIQIKKLIQGILPDYYEHLVDTLGGYRDIIKGSIASGSLRAAIFKELARIGMINGGKITQTEVEAIIKQQEENDINKVEDTDIAQ